jgi:hypothetical protein
MDTKKFLALHSCNSIWILRRHWMKDAPQFQKFKMLIRFVLRSKNYGTLLPARAALLDFVVASLNTTWPRRNKIMKIIGENRSLWWVWSHWSCSLIEVLDTLRVCGHIPFHRGSLRIILLLCLLMLVYKLGLRTAAFLLAYSVKISRDVAYRAALCECRLSMK